MFGKIFDSNAGICTTVPFGTPSFATASGCGFHSGLVSACGSFVLSAFSFHSHRSASGSISPPHLPLWPPSVISSLYL